MPAVLTMPCKSARFHPVLVGAGVGALLAVALGIFVPTEELSPGDSRFVVGIVGGLVLVPASIATAYMVPLSFRHLWREPRLRLGWLMMTLFFTLVAVVTTLSDGIAARRYQREGRQTQGVIVATFPQDHDTLLVAYTASGLKYRCQAAGPHPARTYQAGETIPVYYATSAPQSAWLEEPRWQPGLLLAGWVLSAGVLPVWLIGLTGTFVGLRHAPSI